GEHLAGLIEGLLDISKIEAGRIDVYRDEVRLGEFLEQIVSMFRLQAEAKGIGFVFTRPPVLPERVVTDARRLRQVLINLLSNALKFTAAGQVRLGLAYRNEVAEFVVEDTGAGIAAADHERIFEPFQRIEDPHAPTEGVGLGLTLTRLLVQIMGGEITLDSAPGRGSRFAVRLMLATVHGADGGATGNPALQESRVEGYEGRRRDIVVADDDAAHRGLLDALLAPLGFALRHAADGEACLRLADERMPDLFLLDIAMPGMSGWEVARRLRARPGPRVPILVVSANAGELRQGAGADVDHDGILTKPVSLDAVLDRVEQLLGLTWRCVAPPEQVAAPSATTLSPRQLGELRQLAEIGYVRGIHARLALLEGESPDAAAYLAHLRVLVSEFRMDEFMGALDAAVPRASDVAMQEESA
ncbi:MAG: ATP-binding protein, partial [Janthinobacterium lividum]